jgi:hypothetical protein
MGAFKRMMQDKEELNLRDFEIDDTLIICWIEANSRELAVTIPKYTFEKFLKDADKLDWVYDYSGANGEHVQLTGTITPDEYFTYPESLIIDDLKQFIVSNPIVFRGEVVQDAKQSILSQLRRY